MFFVSYFYKFNCIIYLLHILLCLDIFQLLVFYLIYKSICYKKYYLDYILFNDTLAM